MLDRRELEARVSRAVSRFWRTREKQAKAQRSKGRSDQGARGAVTGGAQMDGFIELITGFILGAGIDREQVFHKRHLELPGFFRPTKEWDLLVVQDDQLIIAVEVKSQAGSFGNNFNNRTEEAMGSALDLWTAFRKGALNKTAQPWLGYLFLLEDCEASRKPVRVKEPHFEVLPEFKGASYMRRYELFCRKLVRERHYNAAAFLTSDRATGGEGNFEEIAEDLSFEVFARSLAAHAAAHGHSGKG